MSCASIWYPPQMPSTGRTVLGAADERGRDPGAMQPVQISDGGSGPGSTARSASITSAADVVQRTLTPGSQANASTSVALLARGSRIAATRKVSRPRGGPASARTVGC